jgi:hypothetical protein
MEDTRNAQIFGKNTLRKDSLGRSRHRWENIKMNLTEIECECANWAKMSRHKVQWWTFKNMVMKLWVP